MTIEPAIGRISRLLNVSGGGGAANSYTLGTGEAWIIKEIVGTTEPATPGQTIEVQLLINSLRVTTSGANGGTGFIQPFEFLFYTGLLCDPGDFVEVLVDGDLVGVATMWLTGYKVVPGQHYVIL